MASTRRSREGDLESDRGTSEMADRLHPEAMTCRDAYESFVFPYWEALMNAREKKHDVRWICSQSLTLFFKVTMCMASRSIT